MKKNTKLIIFFTDVDNDRVIYLIGVYMGNCKKLLVIFFVISLTSGLFAKQISFQVIQHDESCETVTEQSLVIEDGVLNSFFEKGFIVTNSPTVAAESEEDDENFFNSGLGEAFFGYSDYFVQIKVFYEPRTGTLNDVANIQKIDWSLTEAKTGIKIVDKSMSNFKPINKKTDMNKVTSSLTNEINSALLANKA